MPVNSIMRWLIATTLVMASCHSSYSQKESLKTQVNYGLTTGISFTTLQVQHNSAGLSAGISKPETKTQLGYHFGIPFKVTRNRFFLSGELLFVNNNSQVINQDAFNNFQYKIDNNFQWLNIPLNFNYILLQRTKQQLFLGLGFATGKLLKVSTQVSADYGTTTIIGNKIDTYDTFKPWSFFGIAQLGSNFLIGNKIPVTIALSYHHSLNNLMSELPNNANLIFDYGFVQTKARMNLAAINVSYFIK